MDQATSLSRKEAGREQVIAEWAASGIQCRVIAARWARELMAQHSARDEGQGGDLAAESSSKIAGRMDVTSSTATRAQRLLMGAGFLRRQEADRRYYYVA